MSRGEVLTRSFTDVDNTPHDGHAAAAGSVVAMCNTRVRSEKRSTRSTRTPGSPNNNVVPSDTALGSLPSPECFAPSRLQKAKGLQIQRHAHESEITTARLRLKSPFTRTTSSLRCRTGLRIRSRIWARG